MSTEENLPAEAKAFEDEAEDADMKKKGVHTEKHMASGNSSVLVGNVSYHAFSEFNLELHLRFLRKDRDKHEKTCS
jgi:hypothetical protein